MGGKVCYYLVVASATREERVRFGFALRPECQVEVDGRRWADIAARLRYHGFKLVEQRGETGTGPENGRSRG